ncbi:MAG: hypothetical protein J5J00_16210 [Deltaproteobacteria bacterium]|nr:hypothetical protein [Deltaproteobacteria bacterium]
MTEHAKEKSAILRQPSFPIWVYEAAHSLGIDGKSDLQAAEAMDLSKLALSGEVPARPSVLEEYRVRALHAIGLSGLSNEELRAFIDYCNGRIDL